MLGADLTDIEQVKQSAGLLKVNKLLGAVDELVEQVANPQTGLKCAVIAGPPGIGKTFVVNQALQKQRNVYKHVVKGYITPFQFYSRLAKTPGAYDVFLFDDCDGVFNDIQALNVLKAVVDPETQYTVSWHSKAADQKSFRFMGKIIILTNYLLHVSPHYKAFLDRVYYFPIDLTREEVLLKVVEIANSVALFRPQERELVADVLSWMHESLDDFRNAVTLRTFEAALELARVFPDGRWKDLAGYTLLDL